LLTLNGGCREVDRVPVSLTVFPLPLLNLPPLSLLLLALYLHLNLPHLPLTLPLHQVSHRLLKNPAIVVLVLLQVNVVNTPLQ
jgi:hypothetical protein